MEFNTSEARPFFYENYLNYLEDSFLQNDPFPCE